MKTPMTKLMLAAAAATLLCLGVRAANVDISTITSSGYMANDGDVLYGTLSQKYPIDIPDGVTVTLAGITYGDTIHCMGDAVIILQEDTVNTIQPGNPWPAIELWNYGKTLTIRGKGKLVAYGGGHNAAIGPCSPDNGWNRGEGGSLVVESGDITAVGGSGGAGIGASANNNCGSIVIRGGSVTATGSSACGIGSSASGTCDGVTIEGTVTKVVATGTIAPIGSKDDNVVIAQDLVQTFSNNGLTLTIDGYYLIGSVQDWKDFAALVETNPTANAKMTADIDLGDDQTRIGTVSENDHTYKFKGIFDGQGHTLTIKYAVSSGNDLAAPFAKVEDATIKNLHVTGTINSTGYHPCSVVADSWGSTTIQNVWGEVAITSTGSSWIEASALVGCMKGGNLTLTDCLFTGMVNATGSYNGCFIGWSSGSSTLSNCLSTGTFTYTGGGNAFRGNHSNCYVKQFPTSYPSGVTQPTDAQLSDGAIATALQAGREETVWVQGDDGPMLAVFVKDKETIAWLNDDGTKIDTTKVVRGAMPTHTEPTKAATAPYRWVFTGWTPEPEAAVSNTTYTATFQKVADTSLLTNDWQAANGDAIVLTNATDYAVTIPAGASVTINGVTVKGASGGGGAVLPVPTFAAGGKAATTEFVQGEGGKWTLTTFAELSNDAVGADVAAEQIKVYAADTVEGLESASPMTEGVEVKEKKSAVKTTIEVTPPPAAPAQFFKVKFGE